MTGEVVYLAEWKQRQTKAPAPSLPGWGGRFVWAFVLFPIPSFQLVWVAD